MSYDYGLFINGEERPARSGAIIDVRNPATGRVIGQVAAGGEDDVADAVSAAAAAAESWAATSQSRRAGYLYDLARAITDHADELAVMETSDMGKPISVSRKVDLRSAPEAVEYFAGMAGKTEGRTVPVPGRFLNYTVREPYGVVAGIIPWNYPLLQAVWKIAPAIMAGNTVVLKPAEQAPLSPMALVRLAAEAGLPPGVVNAVPGYGEEAGAALCQHPGVALIAFTGSVETGKLVQHAAADRVVPVTLELGGKSPMIVFEDADPASVVALVHAAIFTNQGEVCTAGSRLLVHESVHEEMVIRLLARISDKTVIGDPLDEATTLGPLVDAEQLKRVQGFVDRAREAGTELLTGGGTRRVDGLDSDLFFEPTVFDNVDNASEIAQSEVFGPVLSIIPYDTEEDAIKIANDSAYGLAGSVWTTNVPRGIEISVRIRTGTYAINWYAFDPCCPFGGYKNSGIGRENGPEGVEHFTQQKSVLMPMGYTTEG